MATAPWDVGGPEDNLVEESAAAKRRALQAAAQAVHEELVALSTRHNQDSYRKCELLARVRDDRLHVAYAEGFGPYAVRYRFTTSERQATAMAALWTKLKVHHALRAVFAAGTTGWTLVREAADMADAGLATDAELAKLVANGSHADLRALKRRALIDRGESPTTPRTFELKEETDARLARLLDILSARARPVLGRPLTLEEGFEQLLALAEQAVNDPAEPALPEPLARIHLLVDAKCDALLHGPKGLVRLCKETFAILTGGSYELQRANGKLNRSVPRRLRRMLWERDRGQCRVPGCGRSRYLHLHHEGEGDGGYLQIGHDPERMFHLCTTHHVLRHWGWLQVSGRHSTGFRFLRADGTEVAASAHVGATVDHARPPPVADSA